MKAPRTSLLRDTALAAIALTVIGRSFYILAQILAARGLGPDGFGLFALAWTLVGICTIVSNLGLPQSAIRFDIAGRTLWTQGYLPLGLAASTLASLGLIAAAEPLCRTVFDMPDAAPAVRALAVYVPLTVMVSICVSGFKSDGRVLLGIAFASLGLTLGPLLAVLLTDLFVRPTPASVALAYSLGLVPGAALAAAMTRRRRPDVAGLPSMGVQIRFGLQTLLNHAVGILNLWIDRLVMGLFAVAAELGFYHAASQLSMIPMMLGATINSVYEPRLARSDTIEARTRAFVEAQLYQIHVMNAGCLVGVFTAPFWLGLLFGPDFSVGGPVLAILLLGQMFRAVGGPGVVALNMAGLPKLALRASLLSVAVNLVLNFALIPAFGGLGAAVATAVAAALLTVQSIYLCLSRGLVTYGVSHLRAPAAAFSASLVAIVAVRLTPLDGGAMAVATLMAGLGAYTLCLALYRGHSEFDRLAAGLRGSARSLT